MKTLGVATLVLMLCGFADQAYAREDGLPAGADKARIVENLLAGLRSENDGLRRSSALMLGQIYAGTAAIPLMAAFRDDENPQVRIAAAWALCRMGSEVGTYIVKQRVRFEDDAVVKAHSAYYYDTYVREGVFTIVEIVPPTLSQMFTPVPVEAL